MNKKLIIIATVVVAFVIVIALVIYAGGKISEDVLQNPSSNENTTSLNTNFELVFEQRKDRGVKDILTKNEIEYSYNVKSCGGNVYILINGQKYELRQALLERKITVEEIIEKANQDVENNIITGDVYRDGGSRIYLYSDYTIIKCNSLNGNRDVYIGDKIMNLNDIVI